WWCGVPESRIAVIRNSARLRAFKSRTEDARGELLSFFPRCTPVSRVVLAAGRLSPEKGFQVLIEAAPAILDSHPRCGIVLFGEGAVRAQLERRVAELGIESRFRMPGFSTDLD